MKFHVVELCKLMFLAQIACSAFLHVLAWDLKNRTNVEGGWMKDFDGKLSNFV